MKRRKSKGFVIREDIMGDKPIFWAMYANETKSRGFGRKKDALAFLKRL